MPSDHSADPFSTFLNATNRQVSVGHRSAGPGRSTDALPPLATLVLRALHGRPRTPVGELRAELGLTTLQIAEAVAVLQRLELVEVTPTDADEAVQLSDAGRDFLEGAR
ncbi:MarR family transcriptional regulator [Streptomyces sp. NPDC017966]|uniref:MarR family transcriptional regulator n=1 Tax=unclassified Streptomyces TaxID=2593676 RepID=UPI001C2370FE|nr:helix-turn-helix domain-containing protein [Streptomyces sp. AC558_RSS880]